MELCIIYISDFKLAMFPRAVYTSEPVLLFKITFDQIRDCLLF